MDRERNITGTLSVRHVTIIAVWFVIFLAPLWRIVAKTGYPGALALRMLVPLVNLVLLWVFAFSEWPVEKRADRTQSPS